MIAVSSELFSINHENPSRLPDTIIDKSIPRARIWLELTYHEIRDRLLEIPLDESPEKARTWLEHSIHIHISQAIQFRRHVIEPDASLQIARTWLEHSIHNHIDRDGWSSNLNPPLSETIAELRDHRGHKMLGTRLPRLSTWIPIQVMLAGKMTSGDEVILAGGLKFWGSDGYKEKVVDLFWGSV